MKITLIFLLSLSLLYSSMLNGPHDLSSGDATTEEELCIFCHPSSLNSEINTSSFALYTLESNASAAFIDSTLSCLSCHDGVSAVNQDIHSVENLVYLNKMHPVSIIYNEEKNSLKNKNTLISSWDNATKISDILVNGEVQCVSCHNPHNNQWGTFLRHTNTASQLCKTCHKMSRL